MAKVTCKSLTYAPYTSGGDGSAIVYGTGKMKKDYLCNVDLGETRDSQKEYADGHQIDSENSMTEVTLALELANTDADIKKDILGYKAGSGQNAEMSVTGDDAPFVGIGFILANRHKGVTTYEGYWIYKIQFSSGGVSSATRRDTAQWQHETINGSGSGVTLTEGGDLIFYAQLIGQSTEAAVETWLKGKAGIS